MTLFDNSLSDYYSSVFRVNIIFIIYIYKCAHEGVHTCIQMLFTCNLHRYVKAKIVNIHPYIKSK